MEPTSQQELKQLLDEGKVSQTEYDQLLEAMKSEHCRRRTVRPKLSRKKVKIGAILFTMLTAIFAWMPFLLINSQTLQNKPIVIGVNLVCAILFGIKALRYWISYWTFKDTLS